MKRTCPWCGRVLEFLGDPPAFCAYCGKSLANVRPDNTAEYHPQPDTAGASPAPGGADSPPSSVGGYRLLRKLGEGGMGAVYEAEASATGQRVAVKLIAPEFAAAPEAVERFRQEGRLASAVSHPCCVFVLTADEDAGRPYIVMELMPGSTLHDLVAERGPLPPEDAVARILDVLEGLDEAHHHGVIHRDVKPSNCFLGADGRVKVGDFGLAKSLVRATALTRTGSFLGTPLFASPEQVRCEPLDRRTDVYSAAATLYYLLTGRAPFESADAAAVVARIASDRVPAVRSLRPDVPRGLDRAVLRGLERDRDRRWRTLDEFRAALLPFAPGRLSIGGMGVRFGAYLIDYVVLVVLLAITKLLTAGWEGRLDQAPGDVDGDAHDLVALAASAVWVLYFGLLEGRWGCSLGKRLLQLRVCRAKGSDPPGVGGALWRAVVFYVLVNAGSLALVVLLYADGGLLARDHILRAPLLTLLAFYALEGAGIVLMVCTMRASNGYRGLHELLSGTRVVVLPATAGRHAFPVAKFEGLGRPAEVPERVGPFAVRGALAGGEGEQVLLAQDSGLGREAFVWRRPASAPALPAARREVSRATRLRWLGGGEEGGARWDAFFAPPGCPLPELVARAGPLPWAAARPLLAQLADELAHACADGTLPESLDVSQVWVQPGGRAQLLDTPVCAASRADPAAEAGTPEERAAALLRRVAVLALEGRPRPPGVEGAPRAALPGHAAELLGRLLAGGDGAVRRFQKDLADTAARPVEITRPRRAAHLVLSAVLVFVGLFCCMVPVGWTAGLVISLTVVTRPLVQEEALRRLQTGAAVEFVAGALDPTPPARLAAADRIGADAALGTRLQKAMEQSRRRRRDLDESAGWVLRQYAVMTEAELQRVKGRGWEAVLPADFRAGASQTLDRFSPPFRLGAELLWGVALAVTFWPVFWAGCAFLWRGGLAYRMLGIALVRADGRPASRLRCAGRALLAWAPAVLLLGLAGWLETAYWVNWTAGAAPGGWLVWMADVLRWSVVAVLAAHVALALRSPTRSVPDRLVGVSLVPRS